MFSDDNKGYTVRIRCQSFPAKTLSCAAVLFGIPLAIFLVLLEPYYYSFSQRQNKSLFMHYCLSDYAHHAFNLAKKFFHSYAIGVVNSKKFCPIKCFSTDFTPKATDLPSIFCLASIWSCKAASKSEAPKSTLLYQSCSNKKILADLMCVFDLWI